MKIRVMGIVCLWMAFANSAQAQISWNWNEWFRQKQTEQQYLLGNIVELQVYLGLLKNGYRLTKNGLRVIDEAKQGEFRLHELFYRSLKTVNPLVLKDSSITECLDHHAFITRACRELQRRTDTSEVLRPGERALAAQVISRLKTDMAAGLDELYAVLRDDHLQLTDDERLKHLHALEQDAGKRAVFIAGFSAQMIALIDQRTAEAAEIRAMRRRHGIR